MFSKLVVVLAFTLQALAAVYITGPVASTKAIGGQTLNVTWADDGATPAVKDIGQCSVDIYTGSRIQQTFLQNLAASVDVSKASSVLATIDPKVGQSGLYYFVRFTSIGLKDPVNPQFPYEAFSAVFEIDSMTGTFNSSVLAQIASTSSAGASSTSASTSLQASKTPTVNVAVKSSGAAAHSLVAPASALVGLAGIASFFL